MNDNNQLNKKAHIGLMALLIVATVGGVLMMPLGASGAGLQDENETNVSDVAPYYSDATETPDVDGWTQGHREPTLSNVLHWISRLPSLVLGDGGDAQGGGNASTLMFSVVLIGGLVSVGSRSGVGVVGGSVLVTGGIAGFATTAFLPSWSYVVLLFVVGGLLAAVAVRLWR